MIALLCINNITRTQFMLIKTERDAISMLRKICYSSPLPHTSIPHVLVIEIYDIDNKSFIPDNESVDYWYWRQFEKYEYSPAYAQYYPSWKNSAILPTSPSLKEVSHDVITIDELINDNEEEW